MGVCVSAAVSTIYVDSVIILRKILCCWECYEQCVYLEKDMMLLGAAAGGVMFVRILIVRSASGVVDVKRRFALCS